MSSAPKYSPHDSQCALTPGVKPTGDKITEHATDLSINNKTILLACGRTDSGTRVPSSNPTNRTEVCETILDRVCCVADKATECVLVLKLDISHLKLY